MRSGTTAGLRLSRALYRLQASGVGTAADNRYTYSIDKVDEAVENVEVVSAVDDDDVVGKEDDDEGIGSSWDEENFTAKESPFAFSGSGGDYFSLVDGGNKEHEEGSGVCNQQGKDEAGYLKDGNHEVRDSWEVNLERFEDEVLDVGSQWFDRGNEHFDYFGFEEI